MKKATHLLVVWLASLLLSWWAYAVLLGPVGYDFDFFFLYKVLRGDPTGKVAIVKIDNQSLDSLEKTDLRVLNLSKTVFAKMLDILYADGAKAVGIDVIFANRSADENALAGAFLKYPQTVIGAKIGARWDAERVLPLEAFSGAKWGAVDVLFDKNVVSKVPLFLELPERKVEPLALATYRSYLGDVQMGGTFQNDEYVVNPLRKIPTNSEGTALIPFFREPKGFPAYSLSDVLSGKIPRGTFTDKAVLVGEYGTLIHDSHFSPVDFGTKMPGVEFHANFLEGLFSGQFLRPLSKIETIASFMVAALVSSAVFTYVRIGVSATYAVAFLAVSLFSGWYLLAFHGVVVSYFALAFSGVFIPLPVSYVYRYFVVNRDRHLIEAAFSHYIAPEVVSAIADDPKSLKLGGEKREVTVFFSDIAGFTTISEALGTERLFALISEYLSQMTEILIHNKGTLDKYIGDAVMGFFGAPLRLENPEILACKTALEQHSRLRMLQTRWKKEGIPPVLARIGIHSGEAMVGNIGSKNRFNYTAMGDTVNLASRLEGVNKEYGTFICVSESVAKKASKEFVFRELDTIKVKGKTEGVKIFELMGFSDDPYVDRAKIAAYEEALVPYYAGEFSKARKAFGKISNDPPSVVMAHRCESLAKGETVLENGVFSMKTK